MKKFRLGFTLAEVLITLGVIGVVASITLPTLIKEYNKHAWVNALKENYSLLNQGFRKMMADDGVEFIADTEAWRAIGGSHCYAGDGNLLVNCKDFLAQLKKYFVITHISIGTDKVLYNLGTGDMEGIGYRYKRRNSSGAWLSDRGYIIYLSNGAMIWSSGFYNPVIKSNCDAIHTAGGHMCGNAGNFSIDINGNRGPNEYGKDIFEFYITERGQLAPVGGNDYAVYKASDNLTQENIDKYKANGPLGGYCDNTSRTSSDGNTLSGVSCTGLLIDQLNWKMDY